MSPLLQKKIYDRLQAVTAVTAVISNRVYPTEGPQGGVLPYVIFDEITTTTIETHDDDLTLDRTTVQFTCYAKTSRDAATLRWLVRAALSAPAAMTGVRSTSPVSRQQYIEPLKCHAALLDLTFWHNPSATS
jgi:hypothetical protein